jgi:uncharacterized surface protein with fasciclin (FAS1) repeats
MKIIYIEKIMYWTLGVWMLMVQGACVKEDFTQTTDVTPNIATFLKNSEDYTLFYEAVKKAETASYLDAWGTYTVFAPNNAAMDIYIRNLGKLTLDDLTDAEVKLLVTQHIVTDTVSTGNFRDGKIAKNSVAGMFITTSVRNVNGRSEILLNKESVIINPNQRAGNGWVHGVDKVFTPITKTLMEEIQANPALSLFSEALEEVGLDAILNKVEEEQYFAVLAVTNDLFAKQGITSFADLKAKYSDTGNPKDPKDSLHMHMAYHVIPDLKYVSDLMLQNSHVTRVNNEIILVKVDGQRVLINEEEWLGNIELGTEVDRSASDNTTRNGVLHYLKDDIFIKQRFPFPVYWDPADQPEIRVAGVYGRGNLSITKGFLGNVTWGTDNWLSYESPTTGNMGGAVYNDQLIVPLGTAASRIPWIDFRTPVVVRGRYKVWVGWRTITSNQGSNTLDVYVNGTKLSRSILVGEYRTRTLPDRELEALGYKNHVSGNPSGVNNYICKMVGIIDLDVTDRQTIRFETKTNFNTPFRLDMIHFIPVDMEQIYPQFDTNGNAVYP